MAALPPVKFEVNGNTYSCIPHTGMSALDLDNTVSGIWQKLVEKMRSMPRAKEDETPKDGKEGGTLNAERFMKFFDALKLTLSEMKRDDYESIVVDSFSHTVAVGEGKEKDVRLSDGDAIGDHFADHKGDLNIVLLRIWEANRLSPFE